MRVPRDGASGRFVSPELLARTIPIRRLCMICGERECDVDHMQCDDCEETYGPDEWKELREFEPWEIDEILG